MTTVVCPSCHKTLTTNCAFGTLMKCPLCGGTFTLIKKDTPIQNILILCVAGGGVLLSHLLLPAPLGFIFTGAVLILMLIAMGVRLVATKCGAATNTAQTACLVSFTGMLVALILLARSVIH